MTDTEKTANWNKMVGIRMEPRLRYLAELATEAKGFPTLTDYIKWALEESFKAVTLRVAPEPEPIYGTNGDITMPELPDPESERVANDAMSIGNLADNLWSDSEFARLESLSILAPHLLTKLPEGASELMQYIHSRKDLRITTKGGYKLNRELIDSKWRSITVEFFAQAKGKVK